MPNDIPLRIWEVYRHENEAKFRCIVPNFYWFPSGFRLWYSPAFRCFGLDWNFEIYHSFDIRLWASRLNDDTTSSVGVKVGIQKDDGSEETLMRDLRGSIGDGEMISHAMRQCLYFKRGLHLHSTNDCVLTCTIFRKDSPGPGKESVDSRKRKLKNSSGAEGGTDVHIDVEETNGVSRKRRRENSSGADGRTDQLVHLEDLSILQDHYRNMLLSGDDHDVIIKVQNKQFKAHRCVLRARSPVFDAMFRDEMMKSAHGTVSIDDYDPEVFEEFLQYVYTEKVDIQSVSHAVGLYNAGDKYDFPRLKQRCIEFLKVSLSTTTISDVMTLVARHGEEELLQLATAYFSKHSEEIMRSEEWKRFITSNPIQANEMLLKVVQFIMPLIPEINLCV